MHKRSRFKRSAIRSTVLMRACDGFTYVGLLILVAVMGVTLAAIGTFWHTAQQRAKEQQLLFIGNQFSRAIDAYYQSSPGGAKQFPKRLEDLLQDKRQPYTARYLRKIFADPFTGTTQWGLIKGADGGIVGVRSLSDAAPLKTGNFGRGYQQFAGKKRYSEWQFIYSGSVYTPMLASATVQGNGGAAAGIGMTARGGMPATSGAPVNSTPSSTPVNSTSNSTPVKGALNANNVPPAYSVPPPQPLPPDPTPDQRRANLCQITISTEALICANLAAKLGDAAGMACMASANQRHAVCTGGASGTMPLLDVQYQ